MYTPVNPSFTKKYGVYGGQNYIGMFSWYIVRWISPEEVKIN